MEYYINFFYSIYLHIFLLFCFLTIFFWTVISKTEGKTINNEIVSGVNDGLKNFHISNQIFTDNDVKYLEKYYQGKDSTVTRNNKNLLQFNIAFIVMLLIGFFACIFVRYIFCRRNINWLEVIGENLIILLLVGGIEYYFFMNIASKYVPIMPSYLPNVVKSKIDDL
tara:strand:- start:3396 stop:3896 length:501 start_codon:yes stop_codon:yes gene_type:complete